MTPRYFIATFALLLTLCTSAFAGKFSYVIIDAGHGDQDVGGNYGKVYEKHLALDTALRVEYYLKKKGYKTRMTRISDKFITLENRARLGNRYSNSIFVSIHYNYVWKTHVSGIETFYYTSRSKPLAKLIQYELCRKTRAVNRGGKYGKYYVLRHAKNPAVLVECGFVSHSRERSKIKKGSYRQDMAESIAKGIIKYQSGRRKGTYN